MASSAIDSELFGAFFAPPAYRDIFSDRNRVQKWLDIERVLADKDMVVIKGVNLKTRNMKPSQANPQGGQVTREAPIHVSNVSPVVDGKPTRVRFETRDDGSKVRVAVRGGKVLGVVSPKRDRAKAKTEQKVSTKLSREARKRQAAG